MNSMQQLVQNCSNKDKDGVVDLDLNSRSLESEMYRYSPPVPHLSV